ncbi:GNAT family N-acetyltransferase [Arsenicicoccus dermatophilus]|uniref:GNAT family N-acetyltransferase n=1 Tax=Arsenicicoccus dermatophilus TaxID=1076331 RepID=UPI001F4CC67F|nr:GNAT family N-acetyltransferase [Arsenicicoccus dermatophilus]
MPSPVIRPLALPDVPALTRLVVANRDYLRPWEPRRPDRFWTEAGQRELVEKALAEQDGGRMAPYVILDDEGEVAGRINLSTIVRGAAQHASVGYWVAEDRTGRGLASRAVGAICVQAWEVWRLHRLEAGTLPHNLASQRVLHRNGFRHYGRATKYLHIDGRYQDHELFELLAPDLR